MRLGFKGMGYLFKISSKKDSSSGAARTYRTNTIRAGTILDDSFGGARIGT